ncbi:MAG: SPOR domain-containing protein [Phycisphaerae bacterium]|nr:SPOR domain-containing protein [Phycisphaerae bacterium]
MITGMIKRGRSFWLILLMSAGCVQERIAPETRRKIDLAQNAYQAREYQKTIRDTGEILRETPRGEGAMQAQYLRGMARYRLKEYPAAREDLLQVYNHTKNWDLRIKATDTLGELAYLRGNLDQAERYFSEVIAQTRPADRPADHARFRRGCLYQRQGKWAQADVEFEKVTYHFPKTAVAGKAAQRVRGRSWTIQVGSYKSKQNAADAAKRYQQDGLRTFIEPVMRDDALVFLLQIGRWGQYETAESNLPAVRRITSDAFLHVAR